METKKIRVEEIIPYKNNPRINRNAIEPVANSIREFGYKQLIVVDENDVIIAGHTRWLALQTLGYDEVEVIVASDLTTEQAKAYRLADNKVGEIARWDLSMLDVELAEIIDLDMNDFGFVEQIEVDIDSFFEEKNEEKQEALKICPHCEGIL